MLWNLVLAHMLGDFLIQPEWMVRKRDNWWVLVLHGSIHLGIILILLGKSRVEYWYISILIALIHTAQDTLKFSMVKRYPTWTTKAYIVDQALHLVVIWGSVHWLQFQSGSIPFYQKEPWVMVAIAYLFITYVWFISEKTFYSSDPAYLQDLKSTKVQRMFTRSGLASVFLASRLYAYPIITAAFVNPYTKSRFPRRALLTDVGIAVLAGLFLFWGLE